MCNISIIYLYQLMSKDIRNLESKHIANSSADLLASSINLGLAGEGQTTYSLYTFQALQPY